MQFADLQRPVLSALALGAALCLAPASAFAKSGSPSFSELSSHIQLSKAAVGSTAAPNASAVSYTFDVSGIFSVGEVGDPENEVYELMLFPNAQVIGIGWNVTLFADSPSWLSEMIVGFGPTTSGAMVDLAPGIEDNFPGTKSYSSGGLIDLVDLGLNFSVAADGKLRMEFYEFTDDYAGSLPGLNWDGIWESGELTIAAIPEPSTYGLMALGLLGVAAAARRRKA